MTSVATGTGLTGGTISTSGTISLDANIKQVCIGLNTSTISTNYQFTTTANTRISESFIVPSGFTNVKARITTGVIMGRNQVNVYVRFAYTKTSAGTDTGYLGGNSKIWIGNISSYPVASQWDRHIHTIVSKTSSLTAGATYRVDADFWRSGGGHNTYGMLYGHGSTTQDWPPLTLEIYGER